MGIEKKTTENDHIHFVGNYVGLKNLRIAREINFWIQDTITCLVAMGVVEGQGTTIINTIIMAPLWQLYICL